MCAARRDVVPEHLIYRDDGCSLAPRCLSCPLSLCRFDLPPKVAGALLRAAEAERLARQGYSINQVAAALGVTRRTVFRLKHQQLPAQGA